MLFVFKVLRLIFITIDNVVFELVDWLYQLFMLLAETGIFTTEDIRAFSERIYFFLGLIMVFKVSVSLIQYILNPDAVNDGKIGASKLLKNLVFVLVGIITVPYIFDAAFSLQRIILKDNIIGNLILGTNLSGEGKSADSIVRETGNIMAFSTFTAFFHFNDDYITQECSSQPFDITEGDNRYATASSVCIGENSKNSQEVKDMLNEFYDSKAGTLYREGYEKNGVHKLAGHMKVYNYTFENADGDETFLFDYMLLVTTGGGIFLAYVLLVFCFDVAVRAVKLGFLQLIAPVPLIAKIDPKKGDEVFNKWVKECTSTYVNLFIRLVAIYFALYIITILDRPYNVVTKENINNPFVFVFIIFGALLFVKDLPKLIETLTGMKMSGSLSLGKKMRSIPLIGGAVDQGARFAGRTAGRLLGAGAGLVGNFANRRGRALGNAISNRWNNSPLGQAHQQRVRNGTDLGTRFRNSGFVNAVNRAGTAVGNAARNLDQNNGGHFANAFGRIGRDVRRTGTGLSGAIQQASGYIDRREREIAEQEAVYAEQETALADREAQILNAQVERKAEMERNKTMAAADDAVRARAVKKVKESAAYAQRELKIESMKEDLKLKIAANISDSDREALEADIAREVADFGKWANKDAVYAYIDGRDEFAGRSDPQLTDLIDKRDQTATELGFGASYVGRNAIEADNATTALNSINTQHEGSFVGENQLLSDIKEEKRQLSEEKRQLSEEKRQLSETRRNAKPYMGPGSSQNK